jgi:hypothetical protein
VASSSHGAEDGSFGRLLESQGRSFDNDRKFVHDDWSDNYPETYRARPGDPQHCAAEQSSQRRDEQRRIADAVASMKIDDPIEASTPIP